MRALLQIFLKLRVRQEAAYRPTAVQCDSGPQRPLNLDKTSAFIMDYLFKWDEVKEIVYAIWGTL